MRRLLACAAAGMPRLPHAAEERCAAQQEFKDDRYTVCRMDLRQVKLEVFNLNSAGASPMATLPRLPKGLRPKGANCCLP